MMTLARVTSITRKILKWGAIGILSIIILLTLIRVGTNLRNKFFPPPPPPPTVGFGKLPPLIFPKGATQKAFTYSLDTLTGALPTFSPQIKVYKGFRNQPGFLSLPKARERITPLGFTSGETKLSNTLYQWSDPKEAGRFLKLDIVSNDFDLTSNFYNDPKVLAAQNLPDPKRAPEIAKNFFVRLNLLPIDIDMERARVSFFAIEKESLVSATSLSNAQIVRVDLFQKPLKSFPIVYPQKNTSLIYVLIGSHQDEDKQVVEAHFFHRQTEAGISSTYPIKTVQEAFEELKNNQAYIASLADGTKTEISIKEVSLAYYLGGANQDFFYPVFVFEGNGDFVAYVLAIPSPWLQEPTE